VNEPDITLEVGRAEIARILSETAGISATSVLGRDVEAGLQAAAQRLGTSRDALASRLVARDPASVVALLESVLVHESHFFRHPEQFEALKRCVFASTPCHRPLSLWSAGCAGGEEAYSLAMALAEAEREPGLDRIVASDVSTLAIATAREGVYCEWSLRGVSRSRRMRFFSGVDPSLRVSDPIRRQVEFRVQELVHGPAPGERFDVILCRNVLIYLEPDALEKLLTKFVSALVDGGVLVVSPAELGLVQGVFESDDASGTGLLRKARRPAPAPPATREARRSAGPARPPAPHPSLPPLAPSSPKPTLNPTPAAALTPAPTPRPCPSGFEDAREAARRGDLEAAERAAKDLGEREHNALAHLLLAYVADARGDLAGAVAAAKRALFLDPSLAQAHAALVGIFRRLGRHGDSRRARRNALALIEGLADPVALPGVEEITVSALRIALQGGGE
jgi:chemotaxis protein methyltransferase CheR